MPVEPGIRGGPTIVAGLTIATLAPSSLCLRPTARSQGFLMRSKVELEAQTGFSFRDAFEDIADMSSRLILRGEDERPPLVTIVIPTFQRLDFLTRSVGTALSQSFDRPYQILVIDDDPESRNGGLLLERLPQLNRSNFRYFVNTKNLGIYDNYNQGAKLAESDWLVFLDDDDLLTANFLESFFRVIDRDPGVEALMPSKTVFDEREGTNWSPENRPAIWRAAKYALKEWIFLGRRYRHVPVGKFFWGAVIGGIGGLLLKRQRFIEIGGLASEQFPASDFWMMARYAKLFGLHHGRDVTYRIRVRENETARPETVLKGLRWGYGLQTSLIGKDVPRWYRRLLPLLIAQHRAEFRDFWRAEIPKEELEHELQLKLPGENRFLLRAIQATLRGF